tara:strand:- start:4149 stop:5111 length:963 start_codon:yes stop_codon:yes gene_type:complete
MAKYRSGYANVETLRKYVNGEPTNVTKNNVPGDPNYRPKYLSNQCEINTDVPDNVYSLPIEADPYVTDAYAPPQKSTKQESTITFNEMNKGWTSFHSYVPEFMQNINGDFYTFKDGQMWKHHADENNRNTFYGQSYNTEVGLVSNPAPSENKIFKTIEIEGDSSNWDVTVTTNLDSGHVNSESFKKKEGFYYAYIRRDNEDITNTELLSVQGIGNLVLLNNLTYTFNFVPSSVSIGDTIYRAQGGSYQQIGIISEKTSQSLTVGGSTVVPNPGDFFFGAKSPIAESYGLKGYYANIKLVSNSTTPVEIFAVNSEISKSFP